MHHDGGEEPGGAWANAMGQEAACCMLGGLVGCSMLHACDPCMGVRLASSRRGGVLDSPDGEAGFEVMLRGDT